MVVREQQREAAREAGVDLNQVRLREHADARGGHLRRIDPLHAVADRREDRAGARLQALEVVFRRQHAVAPSRELDAGTLQHDDADVVQEELRLGEEGMRAPGNRFDAVRPGERVVVVPVQSWKNRPAAGLQSAP